ncbi:hypothetical protein FGRMN_1415 [Fusarium graminum]|nr:hypothetical protein FGRMN_1415 [Fusarium graminum]
MSVSTWNEPSAHPTLRQSIITYVFSDTTDPETCKKVIKEYPRGVPPPHHPMLITHIYQSGNYGIIRMPCKKITTPTQLSPSEVDCVSRHLREFDESHPDSGKKLFLITHGDLQYFLHAIFRDWDSEMEIGPMPVLRKRQLHEYTLPLGVFRVDLPYLLESPGVNVDGRRRGDPAYMALTLNKVGLTVSVKWVDKFGNEVDESFVRDESVPDPKNPHKFIIKSLVTHYDAHERIRVMAHNWELAIWGARAQIQVFYRTGIKYGTKYFPQAKVYPAEKLIYAKAHIMAMLRFWSRKV